MPRAQLDHLAYHDALTDLPNRLMFGDHLTRRLAEARRRDEMAAVLFFDLDGFKHINDSLGHNVGDMFLITVAQRLTQHLREVDTIARMGGDEFTIILSKVTKAEDAAEIASRVQQAISEPLKLNHQELVVSASIGISLFPSDGEDAETLVRNADAAMYRAKKLGKKNYQFYSESLNVAAVERRKLETALHKALERDEFVVYYQPRVSLATGQFQGAEALVRWQHPELGLVSPAEFLPLAEETGLIVRFERARHAHRLQAKQGLARGRLCRSGCRRKYLRAAISSEAILWQRSERVLRQVRLEPRYLNLEITESILMQNPELAIETLSLLKATGVRHLDRRLRHRALGAELSQEVPCRHTQDRPVIRTRDRY